MKNKIMKIISLCLCIAILAGGAVYAISSSKDYKKDKTIQRIAENQQEKVISKKDSFKDETVYVIANADGTIQKIIVSDWIKNMLTNEKSNSVEGYELVGKNSIVWDADGSNIYYQGTIEKELPVDISVSYKLDGKTVSPDELAGKSGKVTIRFDYKNNQYETMKINGKNEKIYVPFAMLTGMLLDNNTFANIEVSNGKIINDGDRTAVIGLALPGLQENLAIDREQLEIPSYVEITADVTNFSMGITVTVASNTLFNDIDMEKIDSGSDLSNSMAKLNDAMLKLLDGSSSLYDGLSTLLDKSTELVTGIDQLADGAAKLKDGAYSLDGGAKKLSDGASDLSQGLDTLSSNNDKLVVGAKKVFETLLSTAETQLKASGLSIPTLTIDNYATVLNGLIESIDNAKTYNQGHEQVTSADKSKQDYIKSQIASLKASLDDYNAFYVGLMNYTAGVAQAASGASDLKSGARQLKNGTDTLYNSICLLYDGVLTMKNGAPALVNGVAQLKDGAMQLSKGLSQFNEEGVQKLLHTVDDAEILMDRLKATATVSKNYKSFAEISDSTNSNVKFVYRTDEIK
ncbi:hypothetical protein [Lutispora thermophila]|uniref:X-X-X-Leu-X-X-Gly heptad repeat-containing protein n=1 Tax=Lutispora thermophila DSM 19022 TaxID=1122184 RepID=A0A1M6CY49_9FIRM|nr:hypothetical protein [Lutispora thermophila]SHI65791.1 X-X-X-Leu-X-X-Gly heptad repeat-containing protein [Lutispora thermophila DSM 19022]